jgi:hypothetical protein
MIASKKECRSLIDFLISRWKFVANFAAHERIYFALCEYARINNSSVPEQPPFIAFQPGRQIEIIKQRIIEILPEAHFIDYTYEAQAPLNLDDFAEVYVADHHQCINKVKELMQKMQIT